MRFPSRQGPCRAAPTGAFTLLVGVAYTPLAHAEESAPGQGEAQIVRYQGAEPIPPDRSPADARKEERFGKEIFWTNAGVGYGFFDLTTVERRTDVTADVVASRVGGVSGHVGAGVRLLTLTLGARVTVNDLRGTREDGVDQEFVLWTLDGELGFKLPFGRVEPFFVLGAGYAAFGGFGDAVAEVGQGLDVTGANVRGGIGVDYYFSPRVSVGFRGTGEMLFLNRRGVPIRDLTTSQQVETVREARTRALQADGSSIGAGYRFFVGPGLHF
jgi:hypothetical protein